MSQFYWGNLRDLTSRQAVANKPIYASDHNAWRADVRRRIQDLNDWAAARDSSHTGTSRIAPQTRGRIEGDDSTSGKVALYVDPDGTGADDNIATRITARDVSFNSGSTATFKLGGAIDVNTTQVSTTGILAAALMTYTIPGGTASQTNTALSFIGFGTYTGVSSGLNFDAILQNLLQPINFFISQASTDWMARFTCVKTASGHKNFFIFKSNRDDTAATGVDTNVDMQHSPTVQDFSSDLLFQYFTNAPSANTVTQEMMLSRFF